MEIEGQSGDGTVFFEHGKQEDKRMTAANHRVTNITYSTLSNDFFVILRNEETCKVSCVRVPQDKIGQYKIGFNIIVVEGF